jgi:molecular chaperone HscA
LLDADGKASIRASMEGVRFMLEGEDQTAIKRAVEALNQATLAFAQARMDKSVSGALKGHKMSDLES